MQTRLERWATLTVLLQQLTACAQVAAHLDAQARDPEAKSLRDAVAFERATTELRAHLLAATTTLTVTALHADLERKQRRARLDGGPRRQYTRDEIVEVLATCAGDKHAAAARLGLTWQGLHYHVQRFGLETAKKERATHAEDYL